MSNKNWDSLNELDQLLRRAYPVGMNTNGVQVTIKKIAGFELFNTRPYHNYETWSDGYEVSDGEIEVRREDLDEAIRELVRLKLNPEEIKPWQKVRKVENA